MRKLTSHECIREANGKTEKDWAKEITRDNKKVKKLEKKIE